MNVSGARNGLMVFKHGYIYLYQITVLHLGILSRACGNAILIQSCQVKKPIQLYFSE